MFTKRLIALVVGLALLLTLIPGTVLAQQAQFPMVGEWLWASTIYDLGADGANTIFTRCAEMGVTDVYLLVKGTAGTVYYNNTEIALQKAYEDRDILQEAIDAAHANGIRLHAWFTAASDAAYKAHDETAGLWHYVRERDNAFIDTTNVGFLQYMEDLVTEIAANYAIDGIHLDYIRYNHLANGWSQADFDALESMGANIERVKYLIEKTFYTTQGDTNANYVFNAYKEGDQDALLIGQYRKQNVESFAAALIAAAKAVNPDLVISAALMPDGAVDPAFGDLHYGQNYEAAALLYDYVLPMAYSKDYGQDAKWVATVAANAIVAGNKVLCGLQAYSPALSASLLSDVDAVRALLANSEYEGKLLGIANFRNSTFQYAKVDVKENSMDITLINPMTGADTELVKVEITIQEGLTIESVTLGEGVSCTSVIGEEGKIVTLEGTELLAKNSKGVLSLLFEGTLDADSNPALVRVWAKSNETRAYHVFDVAP